MDIISRGFVFEEMAKEILDEAKEVVRSNLEKHERKTADFRFLRKIIEDELGKYLYSVTERRPLILPVIMEI